MTKKVRFVVLNDDIKIIDRATRVLRKCGEVNEVFYKGLYHKIDEYKFDNGKREMVILPSCGYPVSWCVTGPAHKKRVVSEKQLISFRRSVKPPIDYTEEEEAERRRRSEKIETYIYDFGYVPTPEEQQLLDEVGPIFFKDEIFYEDEEPHEEDEEPHEEDEESEKKCREFFSKKADGVVHWSKVQLYDIRCKDDAERALRTLYDIQLKLKLNKREKEDIADVIEEVHKYRDHLKE